VQIVECVPNFSEGRNPDVVEGIAAAMRAVAGAQLLDVDPGKATNRTVYTLIGTPDAVVDAAFAGIAAAKELIDMRRHEGEHARQGACDVCPFVPVSGMTMDDCVQLAHRLAKRVGDDLGLPVYLYAKAAQKPERVRLPDIRVGEYEALEEKLKKPEWAPDYGPAEFVPSFGVLTTGARPFLIAYNVNLNTPSKPKAHYIAARVREKGYAKRDADFQFIRDAKGKVELIPGRFPGVQGVGWVIEEYGRAQCSFNLTDASQTGLHEVFEACREFATGQPGVRVTGSEVVGLVPRQSLLDAGRYYLQQQGLCSGVTERRLVEVAIQSMGLAELTPFDPDERVIEYRVAQDGPLVGMTVREFVDTTSSDAPAPGGGSVAALCGSLASGLAAMVGALTVGRDGFEDAWDELNEVAEAGQAHKEAFLFAIDADTAAFNDMMGARRLPKKTGEQKRARQAAMIAARRGATEVPLGVLERCPDVVRLAGVVAEKGLPATASDAGTAAAATAAAARGAYLNVLINLDGMADGDYVAGARERADRALARTLADADQVFEGIRERLEKVLND
jgi:glutamate formiminotransferase/formiminotetrahydrofolate cyclodeaminase